MRIVWSQNMETGNPEIDRDHRSLVEIINRVAELIGHDSEDIGKIICDLLDYVILHFGREEYMMRRTSFPNSEAHLLAHCEFFTKLIKYSYSYEMGQSNLSVEMHNYLSDWLLAHEANEDMELARHVKGTSAPN